MAKKSRNAEGGYVVEVSVDGPDRCRFPYRLLPVEDVRVRQPDEDGQGDDDDRHEEPNEEPLLVAKVHEVQEDEDGLGRGDGEHDEDRDSSQVQARGSHGDSREADEGGVDER
jgi:hypothetical protein